MKIDWEGEGIDEIGYLNGKVAIKIDPRYFRPTEVQSLLGDARKAKEKLGWVPEITLDEMISEMALHDLAEARKQALLQTNGYTVSAALD